MLTFVLITETELVTEEDLIELAPRLELGAKDCAAAWHLDAPRVVRGTRASLVDLSACPVVFLDNEANTTELAYHYVRLGFLPAVRVMTSGATGLYAGDVPLTKLASHEINETLCDALCSSWIGGLFARGMVAKEVSDPTQESYFMVDPSDGVAVQLEDFVTPAWFDPTLSDHEAAKAFIASGGQFNHRGSLMHAGAVGPKGYVLLKDANHTWAEDINGQPFESQKPGAAHPWARSERRKAA